MRTPEKVRWDFVQEWLEKAEQDLNACQVLLREEFSDYSVAAFHAQQAAEKFFKAFLVKCQIEFPKTHDLNVLRRLIGKDDHRLAQELAMANDLTPYAVEFRYPGATLIIPKAEADRARRIAAQVRALILQAMNEYLSKRMPGSDLHF
ncbi:MAG: HEPN domain-containing protein [Nitrospiraceae bacterium]|nr:HEPN domain-containing protein [Nitrospiraceae bacterium]